MTFQYEKHRFDPNRTMFSGSNFIIYNVADLIPRHPNFPHGTDILQPWNKQRAIKSQYIKEKDRLIHTLYIHQTGGGVTKTSLDAVKSTAKFITNDPSWTKLANRPEQDPKSWVWTGTGRGWPGIPYTFYIPYWPYWHGDKAIIFQCWDLDWITWHSSDNYNSIAIVLQGYFRSRHMRNFAPKLHCISGNPSLEQQRLITSFIDEYAIKHLGIASANVKGHCHSKHPKKTCPGDWLESLIVDLWNTNSATDMPLLNKWAERRAVLRLLGHHIASDDDSDYGTRLAIEYQEALYGLERDGYWDTAFDTAIKLDLKSKGITQKDITNIIIGG